MLWMLVLSCLDPEPTPPPRCAPATCLDSYLFSENPYDNTEAIAYMVRYPWHRVTTRQKERLIALARPPAQPRTVENIALLSTPTDVVFLDRIIRTSLHPETDDIPSICADTPIHRVASERNPYCVALLYQISACRRSEAPVCAGYRQLSTDWIDHRTEPGP